MFTESYEKAGASQGTCPPWPRLVQIPEDSFARPNLRHPQQWGLPGTHTAVRTVVGQDLQPPPWPQAAGLMDSDKSQCE